LVVRIAVDFFAAAPPDVVDDREVEGWLFGPLGLGLLVG
jgi:hypothetical protein